MADNNVKEVTPTQPPPQSTDDNRRRTRSQTRNGGISTPPAPMIESRGRKRATQSQPGSGNKRVKEAAKNVSSASPAEKQQVSTPATKETELHSKKAENQDLSTQKPNETGAGDTAGEKNVDKDKDNQKESADEVKSHTKEAEPKSAEKPQKEAEKVADQCSLQKGGKSKDAYTEEDKPIADDKQTTSEKDSEKDVVSQETCKLNKTEAETKAQPETEKPVESQTEAAKSKDDEVDAKKEPEAVDEEPKKDEQPANEEKKVEEKNVEEEKKEEKEKPIEPNSAQSNQTDTEPSVENCALPKKTVSEASGDEAKKEPIAEAKKDATDAEVEEKLVNRSN